MRDSDPMSDRSVFEVALEAGLPPGADEEIVARLRELVPNASQMPVRYASHLPPNSVLEGSVRHGRVHFLKTYQGEHFTGYRIGDHRIGTTIANHSVHYQGRVTDDGATIEGRWLIHPQGEAGRRPLEGGFVLRRQPGPKKGP
jgi:hypothetical protein